MSAISVQFHFFLIFNKRVNLLILNYKTVLKIVINLNIEAILKHSINTLKVE